MVIGRGGPGTIFHHHHRRRESRKDKRIFIYLFGRFPPPSAAAARVMRRLLLFNFISANMGILFGCHSLRQLLPLSRVGKGRGGMGRKR